MYVCMCVCMYVCSATFLSAYPPFNWNWKRPCMNINPAYALYNISHGSIDPCAAAHLIKKAVTLPFLLGNRRLCMYVCMYVCSDSKPRLGYHIHTGGCDEVGRCARMTRICNMYTFDPLVCWLGTSWFYPAFTPRVQRSTRGRGKRAVVSA